MANPRSLVFQLYKYWDIVESLCRAGRELPAFNEAEILGAAAQAMPSSSGEEQAASIRALVQAGILETLPRSEDLQLNPLVLDFVRGLTREHELGLASVLAARIEAIRGATEEVAGGTQARDVDRVRQGATRLAELFRQIRQQLDQDRHAILELAEQAKSAEGTIPLAKRYRRVLSAYDDYVEPMNQMMDSGPAGTFYRHLETAQQALHQAYEQSVAQGALYTHRLQLHRVVYQAGELRQMGRVVARHCAATILPLREELRAQNTLSNAVSSVLGQVRKKGLRRALPGPGRGFPLPLWRPERRRRVSVGDEVLDIMARARDYTPVRQDFPEELASDPLQIAEWVDEKALRGQLSDDLPVPHLMRWLRQHYARLPDAVLLRLYHDLVRDPAWRSVPGETEDVVTLNEVRVRHHPHRLEAS